LDLHENFVQGTIPDSLGALGPHLTELVLYGNNLGDGIRPGLIGPIPASIGSLSNLVVLQLYYNGMSGPIPESLGNLKSLRYLNLYANELVGTIPNVLGNLPDLKKLELSSNRLSGSVPPSVCDWISSVTSASNCGLNLNNFTCPFPAKCDAQIEHICYGTCK